MILLPAQLAHWIKKEKLEDEAVNKLSIRREEMD